MATKLTDLQSELEQIMNGYNTNFAGQSRATRDVPTMDGLIARTKKLITQIEMLPAMDGKELLDNTRAQLEMYERERVAIVEAKAGGGTDSSEFAQLASFANFAFARYLRHFAGQARATRDLGLLKELVDELRTVRKRMSVILATGPNTSFQRDADLVSQMIERYEEEKREIEAARHVGTVEERAGLFADLANVQIELYRQHFMGQSRITRRPALLQRIIDNLKQIRSEMGQLKLSGKSAENNRGNITIVDNTLRHDETELGEIRKARQGTAMKDILGMLGGAANECFEEYRKAFGGQDRRKVDLTTMSVLCDKLGEIARQMYEMGRSEENEMNERNIEIVIEQLRMYEEEWREIHKSQTPAESQT